MQMRDVIFGQVGELRHEPTEKRIRAVSGDVTVADSTHALLVWEPRRIVPSYAVPVADLAGALEPSTAPPPATPPVPLLHPGIPFAVHATPGQPLDIRLGDRVLAGAAFRPEDADLDGYRILDFKAFDRWYEEDAELVSHPRDPFHRVDVRRSSRRVRIEYAGRVLAESEHPTLVFETNLPVRFYLPRADLREPLTVGSRQTACAYKGHATHYSVDGRQNIAWTYAEPLADAVEIADLVAFYDEIVDVYVDGEPRPRPDTPAARVLRAEFVDRLD